MRTIKTEVAIPTKASVNFICKNCGKTVECEVEMSLSRVLVDSSIFSDVYDEYDIIHDISCQSCGQRHEVKLATI